MFLLVIEVARKLPKPARPKMTSVMAAPVRMLPNWSPIVVIAGMEEFRSVWPSSTRRSLQPRARAERTCSVPYSSITRPRMSRVRMAA